MATYELTIITAGADDTKAASAIVADTKKTLTDAKASVTQEHQWGRRPLAYVIAKQNTGYYTTFEFSADPSAIEGIERAIRLHGKVLRFLTTEAFEHSASLAAPAPEEADDETRTAEEQLRRGSSDKPKRTTKKKVVAKPEDETERKQQVEEALSRILEDETTDKK